MHSSQSTRAFDVGWILSMHVDQLTNAGSRSFGFECIVNVAYSFIKSSSTRWIDEFNPSKRAVKLYAQAGWGYDDIRSCGFSLAKLARGISGISQFSHETHASLVESLHPRHPGRLRLQTQSWALTKPHSGHFLRFFNVFLSVSFWWLPLCWLLYIWVSFCLL